MTIHAGRSTEVRLIRVITTPVQKNMFDLSTAPVQVQQAAIAKSSSMGKQELHEKKEKSFCLRDSCHDSNGAR
jgi:hypothetical protein